MKILELPPLEVLNSLLTYCPDTGELRWKVSDRHRKAGKIAGSYTAEYAQIQINKVRYALHRVAYALHTQAELSPDMYVDHIDGDKYNNRAVNLRATTSSANNYNRKPRVNLSSGHRGVYLMHWGRWKASIYLDKKSVILGHFDTKEEAITARLEAEREHGIFVREV